MSIQQERNDMRKWADAISVANKVPMLTDGRLNAAATLAHMDITRAVRVLREAADEAEREVPT